MIDEPRATAGEGSAPVDDDVVRLAGTPRLLVATDFDGVLAPIVSDPERSAPLAASMVQICHFSSGV